MSFVWNRLRMYITPGWYLRVSGGEIQRNGNTGIDIDNAKSQPRHLKLPSQEEPRRENNEKECENRTKRRKQSDVVA